MSVKFVRDFLEEEIKIILSRAGVPDSAPLDIRDKAVIEFLKDPKNAENLARDYERRHNITTTEGEFREALAKDSCLEFRLSVLLQNLEQTLVLEEMARKYCLGKYAHCPHRKQGEISFCGREGNYEYNSSIISYDFLRKFDETFREAIKNHKWFSSERAKEDVGVPFALSDFAARHAGTFCRDYATNLASALQTSFKGARLSVNLRAWLHVHESHANVMLEDYTCVHEFNGN
jgi:hypothetical protein